MSNDGGYRNEGVNPPRCGYCQGGPLTRGFFEDTGERSSGYTRWIPGALERGIFGGARLFGKQRIPVHAFRCDACGHLELFVFEDDG